MTIFVHIFDAHTWEGVHLVADEADVDVWTVRRLKAQRTQQETA